MEQKGNLRLIETHELKIAKHLQINFEQCIILKNGNIAIATSLDYFKYTVILIINTTTWTREAVLSSKEECLERFAELKNGYIVTGLDMCVWDISDSQHLVSTQIETIDRNNAFLVSIELLNNNEMAFTISGAICIDIYSTIYPYKYLYSFEEPSNRYVDCKGTFFDRKKNLLLLSVISSYAAIYCFNTLTRQKETIITNTYFFSGHIVQLTNNTLLFQYTFFLTELNLELFTMRNEKSNEIINRAKSLFLLSNNDILVTNIYGKIHKMSITEHKITNFIQNYIEVTDYYHILENTIEKKIIVFSLNKVYIYSY